MKEPLSFVEAIRDFHPDRNRPPVLHYPIRRIAYNAERYLTRSIADDDGESLEVHWEPEEILQLAEGLDEMRREERRIEELDHDGSQQPWNPPEHIEEFAYLGLDFIVPADEYERFVLPMRPETTLLHAIAVHALGVSAQANALAHDLAKRWWPTPLREFERMAELAIEGQQLVEAAERHCYGLDSIKRTQGSAGKEGANVRHSPRRTLYDRFSRFYLEGDFPSRREAAKRFFEGLNEQEQRTITNNRDLEPAIRNLTNALRKYLQAESQ
ncbi:hypothetical protein [Thioalkalivibrio sp. ALJT]|uniref:hypothetical protein n=1 Tax=Thioalkalivibrio sp. ALJT TaxID=1158146 RepID=UPI000361C32A|nr:hypothetical protein [Thioalkalivibrio sp. ALJT]